MEKNKALDFDAPPEPDPGWPIQLKIIIGSSAVVLAIFFIAWAGFLTARWTESPKPDVFGPITFTEPSRVIDADNNVPDEAGDLGLPPPSIVVGSGLDIPIRLERTVDCAAHVCPTGSMAVLVDLRFEEVNTDGTTVKSFTLIEDFETSYKEGEDYILNTQVKKVFNIEDIELPESVIEYLEVNGKEVSAWKILGNTEPARVNSVPGAWETETIHISYPGVGGE